MRTPLTRLYLAPLLLAATLPGAAQAQARGQAAPAQIQSRLQSLVTVGDADIWLASDAPNQKYLFVGGSDSLRIISKNGVVLATIDRVDNVGVSRRSDRVVFTRIIDPKPPAGDGAWTDTYVWTVGIDTATGRLTEAPRRVSINPGLNPSISPDGKEISFIRYGAGGYRIVTIPVRGGEERVVVARPGRIFTHGWSNDGKWIYYSHTPQGARPRIERVIAGGGQPDSLVAAYGAFLGFSRDGQYRALRIGPGASGRPPVGA